MNYLDVYSTLFSQSYSGEDDHIQYKIIPNSILEINSKNNSIIDIGSGKGHLIRALNKLKTNINNYKITSVDLSKFHNESCDKFIVCNLSKEEDRNILIKDTYDILICTDVFEHLDKSYIEDVIKMCSQMSSKCIFGIANHSSIVNGIELHTIQENDIWWDNILVKYFNIEKKEFYVNGLLYYYICNTK
jgi:2-polyprenyl-3-methyl-5-hydroxy-6-metoxy-1,4-benzoquinol methylase